MFRLLSNLKNREVQRLQAPMLAIYAERDRALTTRMAPV
jgi:hypothetical protein